MTPKHVKKFRCAGLRGGCFAPRRRPEAYPGRHYHPRHFRKRSRCPGRRARPASTFIRPRRHRTPRNVKCVFVVSLFLLSTTSCSPALPLRRSLAPLPAWLVPAFPCLACPSRGLSICTVTYRCTVQPVASGMQPVASGMQPVASSIKKSGPVTRPTTIHPSLPTSDQPPVASCVCKPPCPVAYRRLPPGIERPGLALKGARNVPRLTPSKHFFGFASR